MTTSLSIVQKGLLLVGLLLLIGLVFIASLAAIWTTEERAIDRQQESKDMLIRLHSVEGLMGQAIARIAVSAETDHPAVEDLHVLAQSVDDMTAKLDTDLAKHPQLQPMLADYQLYISGAKHILQKAERVFLDRTIHPTARLSSLRGDFFALMQQVETTLNQFVAIVDDMGRITAEERQNWLLLLVVCLVSGVAFNVGAGFLLCRMFQNDLLMRIGDVEHNATMIAVERELDRSVEGSDEIAQLNNAVREAAAAIDAFRQRERTVSDNAGAILCMLDGQNKIHLVGKAAERIWQRSVDSLLGLPVLELVPAEHHDLARQLLSGETGSRTFELPVKCGDGTLRQMSWTVSKAQGGQVSVCVVHNIDQRHRLNLLKQRFVAMVSHDLRSPLQAVGASITLLGAGAHGPLPESVSKLLDASEGSLAELTDLVEDILDAERVEAGKELDGFSSAVSVYDLIVLAQQRLAPLCDAKGVSLTHFGHDTLVTGDSARLERAFCALTRRMLEMADRGDSVVVTISRDDGFSVIELENQQQNRSATGEKTAGAAVLRAGLLDGDVRCRAAQLIVKACGGALTINDGRTISMRLPVFPEGESA